MHLDGAPLALIVLQIAHFKGDIVPQLLLGDRAHLLEQHVRVLRHT